MLPVSWFSNMVLTDLIWCGQADLQGEQLRHHEVKQIATDGVRRTGHRQDVVLQPTLLLVHLFSQRNCCLGFSRPRAQQFLGQTLDFLAAATTSGTGCFPLELGPGVGQAS